MYNLDLLHQLLTEIPHLKVKYYPEIPSTNSEALRLIEEDAVDDGTILLAEQQTAGRGRLKRTWVSDPQDSLTFSLVLRDQALIPDNPTILTLVAGVAVQEALQEVANSSLKIKWPNDILLNGKKVCGILAESVWEPPTIKGVVIGIGVNIGKKSIPPTDQMRYPATSIETETEQKPEREQVLAQILQHLYYWLPIEHNPSFHSHYENHLAFMGESVNIINEVDQTNVSGICIGITNTGELILQLNSGKTVTAEAGEVSIRPQQTAAPKGENYE